MWFVEVTKDGSDSRVFFGPFTTRSEATRFQNEQACPKFPQGYMMYVRSLTPSAELETRQSYYLIG